MSSTTGPARVVETYCLTRGRRARRTRTGDGGPGVKGAAGRVGHGEHEHLPRPRQRQCAREQTPVASCLREHPGERLHGHGPIRRLRGDEHLPGDVALPDGA